MTENELNARLSMMRQAVVDPPLMTDDELPVVQRPLRRRLMFALISSVVVIGALVAIQILAPTPAVRVPISKKEPSGHEAQAAFEMTDSIVVRGIAKQMQNNQMMHGDAWHESKGWELQVIPLMPIDGSAGTTGIELRRSELEHLGIYADSVTVFNDLFGGFTFDTLKCTLSNMAIGPSRRSVLTYVHSGERPARLGEQKIPRVDVFGCRPVGYYAVLQSTTQDTVDKIAMISFEHGPSKLFFQSDTPDSAEIVAAIFSDSAATPTYQRAGKLAALALYSISRTKKPIDEAFNQVINVGKLRLPLKSLFLPIRFQTPWTTMSGGGSEKYRMDVVFIYLATPVCLSAIPSQISAFFGNEYQATLDAVENQLSQRELCDQLHETSILGLCPAKDAPITTVSVGPIPARDHVTVTLKCNSAFAINMKLIDALGNLSYEDAVVQLTSGVNVITIPLANLGLHRGAYTLLLTMDRYETSTRVLID